MVLQPLGEDGLHTGCRPGDEGGVCPKDETVISAVAKSAVTNVVKIFIARFFSENRAASSFEV